MILLVTSPRPKSPQADKADYDRDGEHKQPLRSIQVADYLNDLAASFHALWNMGRDNTSLRFIADDDDDLTRARLAMVRGMASVIASGLAVIGVAPVEEMR